MVTIDERDSAIIEALRRDCRASNAQLARDVGVSEGTIRRRLNRLMADGAIEISVTNRAGRAKDDSEGEKGVGAPRKEVFIRMMALPQDLDETFASVRALPETRYAAIIAGEYNIIAWMEVEDLDELGRVLSNRVRKIEGVELTETHHVILCGDGAKAQE